MAQAALILEVHWQALELLSKLVGTPLQGLQQGGKALKLPPHWRRKLRLLDGASGLVRHVTEAGNQEFLKQLRGAAHGHMA
eukprot:11740914-Prorocentrum_lima.AAC.1